ncbi:MAG: 3-keto-5-aminohexanoate cleavage protein [Acidobacteria bacterium]|nr:3-keto-5-aminohexanoate cleavage protein [Acidobacteriota bacterium]
MLIKAALNGGRSRSESPAIPITPQELAASAREAVAAGAGAIHFHVRGADEHESLDADAVTLAVNAVKSAVPKTPVGISTGAWILNNTKVRYEKICAWKCFPDFASINFKEDGAIALAQLLTARGVPIEGGVADVEGAKIFLASGYAERCIRLLIEPLEKSLEAAIQTLDAMIKLLDNANNKTPRVLHGLNELAWPLIDEAARRGYDTRVGLEDTLTMPDGRPAPGNGALVAEAAHRMGA